MVKTQQIQFLVTYEVAYQLWLDGWFQYDRTDTGGTNAVTHNSTFGARLRTEF